MIQNENWKLKKQIRLFELYENKIPEIYDMYFEKIYYKEVRNVDGEMIYIDRFNYKYHTKEICKKFQISLIELSFLVSQDERGHFGKCKYCQNGVYYSLRTNPEKLSCGHSGYCSADECNELVKSRSYCSYHQEVQNERFEIECIERQKEEKAKSKILYIHDFMPGRDFWHNYPAEYILALLNKNSEYLHKIYLLDIKNIYDNGDDDGCIFSIEDKNYYTWCSATQLKEAINELIIYKAQNKY